MPPFCIMRLQFICPSYFEGVKHKFGQIVLFEKAFRVVILLFTIRDGTNS